MTTPAGWYDDGSGRLRWWDGEVWTEHFAPKESDAEPSEGPDSEPTGGTDADPNGDSEARASDGADAALSEAVADAEPLRDAPDTSADTTDSDDDASPDVPVSAVEGDPEGSAVEPDASRASDHETESVESETTASALDDAQASPIPPIDDAASEPRPDAAGAPQASGVDPGVTAVSEQPSPVESAPLPPSDVGDAPVPGGLVAPGSPDYWASAGHGPGRGAASTPGYAAYPGQTPQPGYGYSPAPMIGGPGPVRPGAPGGPGSPYAGAYPLGYGLSPQAPAPTGPPIVGLIGLGAAALGVIFSMVQILWVYSWILLVGGLVVSLVSLFLRSRKWPGVAGMIIAVVGFIIAAIMGVVLFFTSIVDTYDPYDSGYDYDSEYDPDDPFFDEPVVVEAGTGETVSIAQTTGTTDVTIDSATWSAGNGLADAENGGYLTLHLTWESVGGETFFSPSYIDVESPSPAYKDGLTPDQLSTTSVDDGSSISGILVFDVAQGETYTVLIRDELMRPAARITVTP
ncbi:DUF2510 domain-containing protein [Microbacterium sp. ZW T5_45]|uniref:DUF2510 domain-containing protein n=1 Tax=Microbacterium sp. ZW T5_45 TaxID=3378080 RepID=UPI003854E4D6